MFPIFAGSNPSGYNLTRSLRFRRSASAYLNRTFTTPTSTTKGTYSLWVKRGALSVTQDMVGAGTSSYDQFQFLSSDAIRLVIGAAADGDISTAAVFRDPSSWYHIVLAIDTTQATAANRAIIYVNNVLQTVTTATAVTLNATPRLLGAVAHFIGCYAGGTTTNNYDGYTTEINFIDGQQLTPSSFGSTNTLTGVWQPARYTGSYGTNGFYLPFTDNSALTTSSNVGLGKDFSGNANYWATNNISITAGVTYDSMTDVPTLTSATAANFAVLNPVAPLTTGLTNGNLNMTGTATLYSSGRATIAIPAGTKIYWECAATAWAGGSSFQIGMVPTTYGGGNSGANYVGMQGAGNTFNMGSISSIGTFALNDVMGLAYDQAAGTLAIYKNNTLLGTISSVSTTLSFLPRLDCYTLTESGWINFGQRPFTYTPPTGFVALNTYNLPTSTIVKGNTVMDATLYTGTGASLSVTNTASFKPDLVWVKGRSGATDHAWYDSVRGVQKQLESNTTTAETTETTGLTAFGSAGFTVGALAQMNTSAATYVGWQWQAGQGTTSSNTNGTITSTVSVNASAGFSVVTWSGNNTSGATVGHSLGVAPALIIIFARNNAGADHRVYSSALGATKNLKLNTNDGQFTQTAIFNDTAPTSSVFSLGNDSGVNGLYNYVAYCWTPIAGFSAFGSYTGNGSADGIFLYLGFRPKYFLVKRTDTTNNWTVYDTSRSPYNLTNLALYPDLALAEQVETNNVIDLLSNGVKARSAGNAMNASGGTYIYAAWAENPFKNSLAR